MYIIFNSNEEVVFAGTDIPTSHTGTEFTLAQLPEGEEFDAGFTYTPVDGVAIKGDGIPVDIVEEARMEAEYLATKYQTDREYPPIGDQLDDLFKAGAFSTEMTAQIQATKDAHPKPTGE
jgi:hypothetical protein